MIAAFPRRCACPERVPDLPGATKDVPVHGLNCEVETGRLREVS